MENRVFEWFFDAKTTMSFFRSNPGDYATWTSGKVKEK
jgi:hypothetical protein